MCVLAMQPLRVNYYNHLLHFLFKSPKIIRYFLRAIIFPFHVSVDRVRSAHVHGVNHLRRTIDSGDITLMSQWCRYPPVASRLRLLSPRQITRRVIIASWRRSAPCDNAKQDTSHDIDPLGNNRKRVETIGNASRC